MSWAKVDDGWWCHPKVMGLSLAARGLWVTALSWSCAQRRPVVPTTFLTMIGAPDEAVREVVESGLWKAHSDGWEIHDWAEYQEKSLAEKRAEAGRKGGKKSGQTRARTKQTASKSNVLDEANSEAGARPDPTRPNPTDNRESSVLPVDRDQVASAFAWKDGHEHLARIRAENGAGGDGHRSGGVAS